MSGVKIPHQQLSFEALQGVIEEFILREGTDYGLREASFEGKVAAVRRQLDSAEAVLVFDPEEESVTIQRVRDNRGGRSQP